MTHLGIGVRIGMDSTESNSVSSAMAKQVDETRHSPNLSIDSDSMEPYLLEARLDKEAEVPNISQKNYFSTAKDPLSFTPVDNMFDGTMDNIEFVVESDDDVVAEGSIESKSNPIVFHVTNFNAVNTSEYPIAKEQISDTLDFPSPNFEGELKIEEIIEIEEPKIQTFTEVPSTSEASRDIYKVCYVPSCASNHHNKDKVFWFGAPSDRNFRKIWDICIDRSDRRLGRKDVICHKHFLKEDVIHEFTMPKKDGKITIPYGKPILREGALPCIKFHEECCVPACHRKSGRMFCFPASYNSDYRLWLYMIKNPNLKNLQVKEVLRHRVCQIHFEPDCFIDEFTLKRTAAPTLFVPESFPISPANTNQIQKHIPDRKVVKIIQENISLVCVHGECNNSSNLGKNVFLFPLEPKRCMAWIEACGRNELITTQSQIQDIVRSKPIGVCEDHFDSDSFESLPNKRKLKSSAIPRPVIDIRESKAFSTQVMKKHSQASNVNSNVMKPNFPVQKVNSSTAILPIQPQTCFYKGCTSTPSEDICFFNFPVEKERYELWLIACGLNLSINGKESVLKSGSICSKHFSPMMFDSENKLKNDALPDDYRKQFSTTTNNKNNEDADKNTDNSDPQNTKMQINRIYCAVENCTNFYSVSRAKGMYHKFPDPKTDKERFNIWLSLLANMNLCIYSNEEICEKFMVCFKHFESHFYAHGIKSKTLSKEAVPTMNLTGDIQWFFECDYYKNRLQGYFDNQSVKDLFEEKDIEWRKDDKITNADDNTDKTRCVLEEDGIKFPGMGHYLYMGKTGKRKSAKSKFPYGVYKHFKSGYGLNHDIEIGENIRIHTAIIIDDDDDCERSVLQQLLNKQKNT